VVAASDRILMVEPNDTVPGRIQAQPPILGGLTAFELARVWQAERSDDDGCGTLCAFVVLDEASNDTRATDIGSGG
jgi:hypothetical protein